MNPTLLELNYRLKIGNLTDGEIEELSSAFDDLLEALDSLMSRLDSLTSLVEGE